MEKAPIDKLSWSALGAITWSTAPVEQMSYTKSVVKGAAEAVAMLRRKEVPCEEAAAVMAATSRDLTSPQIEMDADSTRKDDNLIVSIRAAFSCLIVSFVDASPSEIALATMKNMNAIATWDINRTTDATIYITVTSVQVDNMVPNAPFPVAVCPFEPSRSPNSQASLTVDVAPLLVVGLSFAPKHKSRILVSCLCSTTRVDRGHHRTHCPCRFSAVFEIGNHRAQKSFHKR
jgi:hypothetical protein